MSTEAGKITDKRQRLYEQAHGEHFTTGLFGRRKSDASTGGGAPPPLRLLSSMKDYWQNKPDSLQRLRKFNKENPPPKDSKYLLKTGGRIGLQFGGPPSIDAKKIAKEKKREQYYKKHGRPGEFEKKAREARAKLDTRKTLAVSDPHKRTRHSVYSLRKKGGKV